VSLGSRPWVEGEEGDLEALIQGGGDALEGFDGGAGAGELELRDAGLGEAKALRQDALGEAGLGAGPA
jgi:hypothetical protein